MVSFTLLAAIGIGGFVAYKVVGAVAPKIQVSMPGIALPEAFKIEGLAFPDMPTAEGIKEALSGLTDPLKKAVDTLTETAAKIPDPTNLKNYVDEKIGGVRDFVYEQTAEGKALLAATAARMEAMAKEGLETAKEMPGQIIGEAKEQFLVAPLRGAGEIITTPMRAIGLLPEPEQVDKMGAFAFIPFAGLIDKWFG